MYSQKYGCTADRRRLSGHPERFHWNSHHPLALEPHPRTGNHRSRTNRKKFPDINRSTLPPAALPRTPEPPWLTSTVNNSWVMAKALTLFPPVAPAVIRTSNNFANWGRVWLVEDKSRDYPGRGRDNRIQLLTRFLALRLRTSPNLYFELKPRSQATRESAVTEAQLSFVVRAYFKALAGHSSWVNFVGTKL